MIYLDAAATTLEKPPQVRQAMAQAAVTAKNFFIMLRFFILVSSHISF